MVRNTFALAVAISVISLLPGKSEAESVPFHGSAVLNPSDSVFSGGTAIPGLESEHITSILSGSFSYAVELPDEGAEFAPVKITDINMHGTPDSVQGISTGEVTLGLAPSIQSTGLWDLLTGDVSVVFPLLVSYSNPAFVEFLAGLNEPPPFSFPLTFNGTYSGAVPMIGVPKTSGSLVLLGDIKSTTLDKTNVKLAALANNTADVPEPSTLSILSVGLLAIGLLPGLSKRRNRRKGTANL